VPLSQMVARSDTITDEEILEKVIAAGDEHYQRKLDIVGEEQFTPFMRMVLLQSIDTHWREHLSALDYLRQGIHLRGYAQKQPKQEYKREAFELFGQLLDSVKNEVTRVLMTVKVQSAAEVEQAAEVFSAIPQAADRLRTLVDVGLGYVKLGQPAPTLSGGEAQRVKLATELSKRATGKTLYLIDEPTTGLSFYDVHKLMDVMQRLVDKGNSILVIEHNLDVIRCSDWIIDLGPEGGDKGGQIVVTGTPEEVAGHPTSHTGRYLKQVLAQHPPEVIAA